MNDRAFQTDFDRFVLSAAAAAHALKHINHLRHSERTARDHVVSSLASIRSALDLLDEIDRPKLCAACLSLSLLKSGAPDASRAPLF